MVFFSGLMLESTLFMDNIGNGKKVATPGEGLSSPADFLWYLCVCFSVSCSFWITVFVSGLLGVAFLLLSSVYNTYIKGKWKTFQTLHKPYTLPFIYLIISILQSVGFCAKSYTNFTQNPTQGYTHNPTPGRSKSCTKSYIERFKTLHWSVWGRV